MKSTGKMACEVGCRGSSRRELFSHASSVWHSSLYAQLYNLVQEPNNKNSKLQIECLTVVLNVILT